MEEEKSSEWNITDLYNKSFKVVKKNKVLWIFGLALSGGVGSSVSSRTGDFSSLQQMFQSSPKEQSSLLFSNVLGTTTSSPFQEAIKYAIATVPPYLYLLLILFFITSLITAAVIGVAYQAWIKAALITGSELGIKKHEVSIEKVSKEAIPRIKSVAWLDIVPSLIVFLFLSLITAIFVYCLSTNAIVPGFLIFFGSFIFFIPVLIILSLTQIWALREAVLNNLSGFKAFKSGWKLVKGRFWKMTLLGIVNNLLAGFITAIPLFILLTVAFTAGFASVKNGAMAPEIVGLITVVALFSFLFIIFITGIVQAFKAVVWTIAYKQLTPHE